MSILKKGMRGAPVQRLQKTLGISADGVFGPGTEKAVKAFQETKGLVADGIAGPDTFGAMGLDELILLRRGTRGEAVKKLQAALGLEADGVFGPATEKAVQAFQTAQGLVADGLAGTATLAKMDAFADISEATIAKTVVRPEEEKFESEPMPEIKGVEAVKGSTVEAAESTSVWSRVTGWFS